jgi:tRNA threonylcarbamoyladenosine modification (KEOPS) complex Cgi121 subunit
MRVYSQSYLFGEDTDPRKIRNKLAENYPGAIVQTFSSKAATNGFFIQMLAAQTLRAERSGCLLAKKPEIDFLVRLAGTSQISDAISRVGSRPGEPFVLVLASLRPLKRRARVAGRKLSTRPLSESELKRVEQGALLATREA